LPGRTASKSSNGRDGVRRIGMRGNFDQTESTMIDIMQIVQRAARPAMFAVALAALVPGAHAQPKPSPAAMATANELIKVTGANNLFNPLIPGVIEQAKIPFLQQNPALAGELNTIAAKLRTDLAPRFTELTNEVATLYAARFTEPELKQILTFYQSPVGQKLLVQQPQIVDGSMKFAQDWANKLSDEVVAKMREELKKRGHPM
jgi:hypothetical protein